MASLPFSLPGQAAWVLADDITSSIQYEGPWFVAYGTQINLGNNGLPFQGTLHGVTSNASFTYSFTGRQVRVFGTSNFDNTTGISDPSWECSVDGKNIASNLPTAVSAAQNRWLLCESDSLESSTHTLRLVATVQRQPFWFDVIQYIPSRSISLDAQTLLIDDGNSSVQYSPGWDIVAGNMSHSTQVAGATVKTSFVGTSLSWYGFTPSSSPSAPSQATYSINGSSPTTFLVTGPPSSSGDHHNVLFFQTPTLPQGNHSLEVVYRGSDTTTPLTLDYFLVYDEPSQSFSAGLEGDIKRCNLMRNLIGPLVEGVFFVLAVIFFAIYTCCGCGDILEKRRAAKRAKARRPAGSVPLLNSSSGAGTGGDHYRLESLDGRG